MSHPCPDCEEEIECGNPNARPPCVGCENHVCYAEHDEERLRCIRDDIAEAQRRPPGLKLLPEKMLIDLEWLCDRMECS